jgi:hypothetical protein
VVFQTPIFLELLFNTCIRQPTNIGPKQVFSGLGLKTKNRNNQSSSSKQKASASTELRVA